jgi:hypothetical protein
MILAESYGDQDNRPPSLRPAGESGRPPWFRSRAWVQVRPECQDIQPSMFHLMDPNRSAFR